MLIQGSKFLNLHMCTVLYIGRTNLKLQYVRNNSIPELTLEVKVYIQDFSRIDLMQLRGQFPKWLHCSIIMCIPITSSPKHL